MELVTALILCAAAHFAAGSSPLTPLARSQGPSVSNTGVKGLEGAVPVEQCKRACGGQNLTCYYKIIVERYTVLGPACRGCEKGREEDCLRPQCITADGYQRSIITVNRELPSPPIEVCRGDRLVVDLVNKMPDETTSMHWHGLRQRGTQYHDGVPYVTQCPIPPGATFRYDFMADDAGTYFYHSHTGTQKLDGLAGALIVREEQGKDVHSGLYDEDEHVVLIGDWTHVPAEHLIPGLHSDHVKQAPITFLVNGRGSYYDNSSRVQLPLAEFEVEPGLRYRFRLIGANCMTCGALISIQNHTMLAISADGNLPFEPVLVHSLIMNPADRFDVILTTDQPDGVYIMHVEGIGPDCDNLMQHAVIRYKNSASRPELSTPPPNDLGIVLNGITKCEGLSSSEICKSQLRGYTHAPEILNPDLYHQIELALSFYSADEEVIFKEGTFVSYDEPKKGHYIKPYINRISFTSPPSPLISQLEDIPADSFCSEECKAGNTTTYCSCSNVMEIKLNSTVDVIITDEDNQFAHPFHLHGYSFYVLEMKGGFTKLKNLKKEVADVKERLRNGQVDLYNKVQRDTITVPFGGYVVIRFIADNPGYWILHCHFAFHLEGGMAAVFKVGEPSDLPPVPKNFPRCGNFL